MFLSLHISDFNLFLCDNWTPPEKSHVPLSQQPPLKVVVLSSSLFFKIWLDAQPTPPPTPHPTPAEMGDAQYAVIISKIKKKKGKSSRCKVHAKGFIFKYKYVCYSL